MIPRFVGLLENYEWTSDARKKLARIMCALSLMERTADGNDVRPSRKGWR